MFSNGNFHNSTRAVKGVSGLAAVAVLAFAAGLTGYGPTARADDAKTTVTVKEACHDDYKKLCGSVTPGGGRIKQCMKDNADKLSERCRTAIAQKAAMNAQKKP
jgi:Cysteine rich repeat